MSEMEMRYWPRLGIYVTRADAEAYISKVGGQHTYADDDLEEFVPAPTHNPEALTVEVNHLFENPPLEAPEPSEEIKTMLAVIQFEEQRVPLIKKWIKEEGMDKQEAKDRFQAEMDAMVRDALGLPEETEQEIEYREKAAAIAAEREAAMKDAESEEE
ncbi:hypothetical protein KAR04_01945 [Candidatus Calescamantes bacterium]|jgi:hypothetical protein|nr:hypothetical protein [Candidatus Calescamantes bacterium]|tara:strand:+ start:639 stop:1112 length:474 start_codon:yes stop_codon:yes gene_type:complete